MVDQANNKDQDPFITDLQTIVDRGQIDKLPSEMQKDVRTLLGRGVLSIRTVEASEDVTRNSRKEKIVDLGKRALGGALSGAANTAGFITGIDPINDALNVFGLGSDEPVGGSRSIKRSMRALGLDPTRKPGDTVGAVSEFVTEGAGFLKGASVAKKVGTSLSARFSVPSVPQTVGPGMSFRAAASETAANTGAGVAVASVEEDDDPVNDLVAGLLAGFSAQAAFDVLTSVSRVVRDFIDPLTKAGQERRVGQAFRQEATDPVLAEQRLEGFESPLEGAEFGSGTVSADPGLLVLERSLARHNSGEALANEQQLDKLLSNMIRKLSGKELSDEAVRGIRESVDRQTNLLDQRIEVAKREASDAVNELPPVPGQAEASASRITRNKVDEALSDSRAAETEIWTKALGGEIIGTTGIKNALRNVTEAKAKGDPNIPATLKRKIQSLGTENNGIFVEEDTIVNIQSIRSEILHQKRVNNAKDAPDRRLNKQLDLLDESVLSAMTHGADDPKAVEGAIQFSRHLNDRYTRGPIGKLLGFDSQGAARTRPELTLEAITASELEGSFSIKELLRSTGFTGPGATTAQRTAAAERTSETSDAVRQFIKARFARAAMVDGKFNESGAQRFIQQNEDALRIFPELRDELTNAKTKNQLLGEEQKAVDAAQKHLDTKDRARLFMGQEDSVRQLQKIMRDPEPVAAFDEILKRVDEDETGRAKEGLKSLYAESLLDSVQKATTTAADEFQVSEAKLNALFKAQRSNIQKLYGADGVKRVEKVQEALRLILRREKAKSSTSGSDTVENLMSNKKLSVLGGFLGLRVAGTAPISGGGQIAQARLFSQIGSRIAGHFGADTRKQVVLEFFRNPKFAAKILRQADPKNEGVIIEDIKEHLRSVIPATLVEGDDLEEEITNGR